jgi:hypothetical protein
MGDQEILTFRLRNRPDPSRPGRQCREQAGKKVGMTEMNLDFPVNIVAQPNQQTDCWAASFAMLLGTTCEDVSSKSGLPLSVPHGWDEIQGAMTKLGLRWEAPACYTVEGWYQLLQRNGPMWLVIASSYQATFAHAIVPKGRHGDGTPENTDFVCLDPGGSGSEEHVHYDKLEAVFEYGSIADAEIVHR